MNSIQPFKNHNCTKNKIKCIYCPGPQGPRGLTGPKGATGVTGSTGATGVTFLTGIGASSCTIGTTGNIYIDTLSGLTYYKMDEPTLPVTRPIPASTGSLHSVGASEPSPYNTIQGAINASTTLPGDVLQLEILPIL
ncbi:hypothetical protein ACER0A_010560 [Haloimpatiens sp. FM7315]|uniref:hypothetical protein n=1 Tax=Haloimpatiens sp. FM7315 TaxID=3298609 RepID=UPI0035A3A041